MAIESATSRWLPRIGGSVGSWRGFVAVVGVWPAIPLDAVPIQVTCGLIGHARAIAFHREEQEAITGSLDGSALVGHRGFGAFARLLKLTQLMFHLLSALDRAGSQCRVDAGDGQVAHDHALPLEAVQVVLKLRGRFASVGRERG
jgi:hypothetical protein